MPTLEEVKQYLRVSFDDDDTMIASLISVADTYVKGAIGKNYNENDGRAKMLVLIVVKDLYDKREFTTEKADSNIRRLVEDFCFQLKVEYEEAISE